MQREYRMAMSNKQIENDRYEKAGIRPRTAVNHCLQKVPLYDLVFRIPVPDLHRPRDDRQGRQYFRALREKERQQREGTWRDDKRKVIEGHAWVSIGLPDGTLMEVLVDENQKVLAKRLAGSEQQTDPLIGSRPKNPRMRPMSAHI